MRNLRSLAFVSVLSAALLAQPALAEIGRVKNAAGEAWIKRNGQRLALAANAVGTQLEEGDVLETGKNGRIAITFTDNTRFAVGPKSTVAISEYKYDRVRRSGSFVSDVSRGAVGVSSGDIAKSKRDAMKVRTPTSLLGVRGTRFVVTVD